MTDICAICGKPEDDISHEENHDFQSVNEVR